MNAAARGRALFTIHTCARSLVLWLAERRAPATPPYSYVDFYRRRHTFACVLSRPQCFLVQLSPPGARGWAGPRSRGVRHYSFFSSREVPIYIRPPHIRPIHTSLILDPTIYPLS